MHYIGMDVHKRVTMICVLDENGKVVREAISKGSLRQLLEMLKQIQR